MNNVFGSPWMEIFGSPWRSPWSPDGTPESGILAESGLYLITEAGDYIVQED